MYSCQIRISFKFVHNVKPDAVKNSLFTCILPFHGFFSALPAPAEGLFLCKLQENRWLQKCYKGYISVLLSFSALFCRTDTLAEKKKAPETALALGFFVLSSFEIKTRRKDGAAGRRITLSKPHRPADFSAAKLRSRQNKYGGQRNNKYHIKRKRNVDRYINRLPQHRYKQEVG